MTESWRLNKYLAASGLGARRKVEQLILDGRVAVNDNQTRDLATRVVPGRDVVKVDGRRVGQAAPCLYRYYKPRGVVCSLQDERDRLDLRDVAAKLPRGCVPVGRLDRNSEGLLLWTNRGDWANLLTDPRRGMAKTYRVTLDGQVGDEDLEPLIESRELPDGTTLRWPVDAAIVQKRGAKTVVEMVLREGKKNQIRQMCEAAGLTVKRLVRVEEAGIGIRGLRPGQFENVTGTALRRFLDHLESLDD